jgi:hypothetical protein
MPSPIDFWQDRYGIRIDIALVMKESGFHYYLDSVPGEWVKVAQTAPKHGAALYLRRSGPLSPDRRPTPASPARAGEDSR